jgi:hypothetical protein
MFNDLPPYQQEHDFPSARKRIAEIAMESCF